MKKIISAINFRRDQLTASHSEWSVILPDGQVAWYSIEGVFMAQVYTQTENFCGLSIKVSQSL